MTQAIRLVFDDCLSKHATQKLYELAKFGRAQVEIAHLATLSCEGFIDDNWIPQIAERRFVVVTTDRGKKPSRGGKLPILCRRHKVTFIMMSAAVHNLLSLTQLMENTSKIGSTFLERNPNQFPLSKSGSIDQFGKMRAVMCVWPKIIAACAGVGGAGYLLRKTNAYGFDLVPCRASRDDPDESGKRQLRLALPDQDSQAPSTLDGK